ncbi:MAG: SAM-dependent methyltransferase [Paenibacillus sp.]|nr:SAM-dependent methyltransferase [Paenibacillus sp.]
MGFRSVLSSAQHWISERLNHGDIVIDATVGNGVDTLFLCQAVGPSGHVYGFDIQQRALEQAKRRIDAYRAGGGTAAACELFLRSHSELIDALPADVVGQVSAVMFNLGYLPGGPSAEAEADHHSVITRPGTTIPALQAAARVLRIGGVITIVLYSGHEGGSMEAEAVQAWSEQLPQEQYQAVQYRFINARAEAPYLIAILKKPPAKKSNLN